MKRKYDVIIVGCGVAGCFTALHLPKEKEILMISKSRIEDSDSFLAQGGICMQRDDDDFDSFYEDTMKAGHYENRPEAVDMMIRSSRTIIQELMDYGVEFTTEDGKLIFTREGAHSKNRILYHDDVTGKEITSKLLAQVEQRENITIRPFTEMVDLLCKDNCCHGILVKTVDGELLPLFGSYVMWACGGIGGIYENSTNFPQLTGDALALSLKYNIEIEHINYIQIHPTTLYSKRKDRRFLISESVRGEGAHLYDRYGRRFVNELLPRDLLTQEIKKQMKKDNMPFVWLSMKPIKDMDVRIRFPNIYKKCLEEGFDVAKDWIPVVPAQHYFMGGVKVDIDSRTSMKDLYAAGETSCNGVHGANRLASNSLLESLVFARNAALHMMDEDNNDHNLKQELLKQYQFLSIEDILKLYELDANDYRNMDQYHENCKSMILDEIRIEDSKK